MLSELLKLLTHRQRPYLVGPFVDWAGYSFPSGHTMSATLLYGMAAACLLPRLRCRYQRLLLGCFVGVIILMVGFSRVALGAHYMSDVVAAIAFGLVWLMLCPSLVQAAQPRRAGRSLAVEAVA
jgi:undecaprenyl-diphosphatase